MNSLLYLVIQLVTKESKAKEKLSFVRPSSETIGFNMRISFVLAVFCCVCAYFLVTVQWRNNIVLFLCDSSLNESLNE